MADQLHHEHAGVRFEPTDISLRGVLIVIAVFVVLIVVLQYLTLRLFEHDQRAAPRPSEAGVGVAGRGDALPAKPRLEQVDRLAGIRSPDVYQREKEKEEILQSYGPTTDKGFVHVPIRWAIEQAAAQIPWRAEKPSKSQPNHHAGLLDAGEPNSGRVFRGGSK